MENRFVTVGDMYGENPGPDRAMYWVCLFIYPNGSIIELYLNEADKRIEVGEDEEDPPFSNEWMTYV